MAEERGTVECGDYTRGHRARITVSRLYPNGPVAWWGRQDIAVYICALAVFFFLVATKDIWGGIAYSAGGGGLSGNVLFVIVLSIATFMAGMAAAQSGLNARDLPLIAMSTFARVTRSGHSSYTADGFYQSEPTVRVADSGCWLLREES